MTNEEKIRAVAEEIAADICTGCHDNKHRDVADGIAEIIRKHFGASDSEQESLTPCEGWSLAFNAFSAGTRFGAKNPDATAEQLIGACEGFATTVFPHDVCDSGEPFADSPAKSSSEPK